jgi:hypothetical protein
MDPHDLRRTLTLASAFKEGDRAVGGGDDERVRREARQALAAVTLGEIHATTLIDDGVSGAPRGRAIVPRRRLHAWTVRRVRDTLPRPAARRGPRHGAALGSEAIAAVVKVMTRDELSAVARGIGRAPHFWVAHSTPTAPATTSARSCSRSEGCAWCGRVVIGSIPPRRRRHYRAPSSSARAGGAAVELPTRRVLSDLVKRTRRSATRASTSAFRASPARREPWRG